MQNISLLHLFIIEMKSILESRDQSGHNNIWTRPPKSFQSTLQYNMQKYLTLSSVCSGDIVVLKILQSDWLRSF